MWHAFICAGFSSNVKGFISEVAADEERRRQEAEVEKKRRLEAEVEKKRRQEAEEKRLQEQQRILKEGDMLRQWAISRGLEVELDLPLLQSLGVQKVKDVAHLRDIAMADVFADLQPRPNAVTKARLYKALNSEDKKDDL